MTMKIPLLIGLFSTIAGLAPAQTHDDFSVRLVELDGQLRSLQEAGPGIPLEQFQPDAIRSRWEQLVELRRQLRGLDPAEQPLPGQIDYLLVVARANQQLFDYQTLRPWARDPMFYLEAIQRLPYTEPADEDSVRLAVQQLQRVGPWLALARANLAEASGALADIALFHLENYDGVGQGEPLRNPPPAGIMGWYRLLSERARPEDSEIGGAARLALQELESFHSWLKERRRFMSPPAHLGWERYQWYLRNVRLMPYTVDQVQTLGQRELSRARTLLEIERRRNRQEPELQLAESKESYEERVRQAETNIRQLIQRLQLLTIPEGLGEFETDAFWRSGLPRHFWEEIQYRDAHNNHIHASIPGHRFDRLIAREVKNPIRAAFQDGGRAEGWAYYVEGLMLQSGLLDQRPRARELFYVAEMARAARIPIELAMQDGDLGLEQAVREMIRLVPLMEENLARYDLEIYLRRPAYGMNYAIGRIQLEELLSQQSLALGESFDLGAFHDRFLTFGWIPITLIGWEMNGMKPRDQAFFAERVREFKNSSY